MNKINFNNEVIYLHNDLAIVIDDFDTIYYVDTGGNASAYEVGDSVNSDDLTPISELPNELQIEICKALNV